MKTTRAVVFALSAAGVAVVLAGCAGGAKAPSAPAPAGSVVDSGIQVMGGHEAWREVESIAAVAVVTSYDEKGQAYISRQRHLIDLAKGTISARGRTPGGAWTVEVSLDESQKARARGFGADLAGKKLTLASLEILVHRVRGPLNFLFSQERPRSKAAARIDGVDVIRIGVGGDNRRALAYYFDEKTRLLRFLTSGGDRPADEGTVTVYTYMMLPNGLAFPQTIRVVKIGANALIGRTPILEVTFSDVSFG